MVFLLERFTGVWAPDHGKNMGRSMRCTLYKGPVNLESAFAALRSAGDDFHLRRGLTRRECCRGNHPPEPNFAVG